MDLVNISDDPNDMGNMWENLFLDVMPDVYQSLRKRRVRNKSSPWLTPYIKKLMHKRDHLKKQPLKMGQNLCMELIKRFEIRLMLPLKKLKQIMLPRRLTVIKGMAIGLGGRLICYLAKVKDFRHY